MDVAALRQRLQALPGTFTLAAGDLGVAAAQHLFTQTLPGATLTLDDAQAAPGGALAATGRLTLAGVGSGGALDATVSFTQDTAGAQVTGVKVVITLDVWTVQTAGLDVDAGLLSKLGFTAARLDLDAVPDDTGVAVAQLGLEADLPFTTASGEKTLTLSGFAPDDDPNDGTPPSTQWQLDAELTGVTLADLAALAALGVGVDSSAFTLPAAVPLGSDLELRSVRVVFDAATKVIVAASAEVGLGAAWTIVAGKCELEALSALFTITYPVAIPRVSALVNGTLVIAGVPLTAGITIPGLQLNAQLGGTVDPRQLFAQYFHSDATIPLQVSGVILNVDASASPPTWQLAVDAASADQAGWPLVGAIGLDDVALAIAGAGVTPTSIEVGAAFAIGTTAQVSLAGTWDKTSGWSLTGRTVSAEGLEIGSLLSTFADEIGAPLPAPLAGLDLTEVALTITGAGGTTPAFAFTITGGFPLGAANGTFRVDASVSGSPLRQHATGTLTLPLAAGDMDIAVTFDEDPRATTFVGSWRFDPRTGTGTGLSLGLVASALGVDVTAIPAALLPVLTEVDVGYDSTGPTVALGVVTADTRSVWAVTGAAHDTYASITAATAFRLSGLPVVGHDLPPSADLGIDSVGVVAASAPLAAPAAASITALVPGAGVTLAAIAAEGLYLNVANEVAGRTETPLALTLAGGTPPAPTPTTTALAAPTPAAAPVPAATPPTTGPPTAWMSLQRSFGPVSLQRVGVRYDHGTIALLLDGGLAAGPLTLGLQDLQVGFDLDGSDPWIPEFGLAGLTVAYDQPPLTIAGSLANLSPGGGAVAFEGGVVIEAEAFSLEAFGHYGDVGGFTSLFLFLEGGAEIGGPPFFFVTGFAAGFGYNSDVRLPSVDQVEGFPMIAALPGAPQPNAGALGGANPSPLTVLNTLTAAPPWITPQLGEYWGAAGITFTTFQLVDSQALLVVEAGTTLSIALLGLSTARFPQEGDAIYAQIELELEARLEPDAGEFWVEAVLAPSSFLLDPACHLTGGFAFCLWFGDNPHAGDFVVTIGGYHPAFAPPSYYPVVPRLGFSWDLGGDVSVSGQAYLALTPSSIQVGAQLDVTFQSGNLRAWLNAGADVIVHWDPFWFGAHIWISVGASYRLDLLFTTVTLSVEIGADLELWGPPTGGQVTVDWYVISFTIPFGSGGPQTTDASWDGVTRMLPAAGATLTPTAGLLHGGASATDPWVVRGGSFAFATATPVPASRLTAGAAYDRTFSTLDVRPLAVTDLTSTHVLRVTDAAGGDMTTAFAIEPVLADVPASLWGPPAPGQTVPTAGDQLVGQQATGLSLTVQPPQTGASAGPIAVAGALARRDLELPGATLGLSPAAAPSGPAATADGSAWDVMTTDATGLAGTGGIAARDALVTALGAAGIAVAAGVTPTAFATAAGTYLTAAPMLATA